MTDPCTSEKLIKEFAGHLADLHKTTSFMRISSIKKKIMTLRHQMMQDVIPVGMASFTITYDASRPNVPPHFYLEQHVREEETIKLQLFMLTELQKIFQHYFEFTHLLIGPKSITLVFELSMYR